MFYTCFYLGFVVLLHFGLSNHRAIKIASTETKSLQLNANISMCMFKPFISLIGCMFLISKLVCLFFAGM